MSLGDDWTTIDHGDGGAGDEGDEEPISSEQQEQSADQSAASATDADTSFSPAPDTNSSETSPPGSHPVTSTVVQDGVDELKLSSDETEMNAEADEDEDDYPSPDAAESFDSSSIRFYEGDKVMYVANGKAFSEGVKVRVVSVSTPNYELALPGGDIIKVPINHSGLYSLDEFEASQLQNELKTLDIVTSELFGGNGGGPFDDLQATTIRRSGMTIRQTDKMVTELWVRSGSIIDGIGAVYSDGTRTFWGGEGGGLHKLVLKRGEYINEVTVRHGQLVNQLTFKTNTGRQLGPLGSGINAIFLTGLSQSVTTLKAPGRFYALASIFGREGKFLDAIGFHWAPTATSISDEGIENRDVITKLSKQKHLKTSELYGSVADGKPFDDGHFNIRLTDITVVTAHNGPLINVSLRYFTGQVSTHGGKPKLGKKTDESSFQLEKGEYVNEIHVRHNDTAILSLTFVTNKGRSLGPCGMISDKNRKDDNDVWSGCRDLSVKAPASGYMLIGLKGRANERKLNGIGFNWSPAPKGH